MDDKNLEIKEVLDPFRAEYGDKIQKVQELLRVPKTFEGENIHREALNNPIFRAYNRLHSPYGSLLALLEYDEIGKKEGEDYFSNPTTRRIVLRALGASLETTLKSPYLPQDKETYQNYQPFFNNMLKRLRSFDAQIRNEGKFDNFVNSLCIVFSQEVNELKGVKGFHIKTATIRRRIAGYLPKLEKINGGKLFQDIKSEVYIRLRHNLEQIKINL